MGPIKRLIKKSIKKLRYAQSELLYILLENAEKFIS